MQVLKLKVGLALALALALAFWTLPLPAQNCPPDIAALGSVQDAYRSRWFGWGQTVSGPVSRTSRSRFLLSGRRYSLPATVVTLDAAGNTTAKQTGKITRFHFSYNLPVIATGAEALFGLAKVIILPIVVGSDARDLAVDYFGWWPLYVAPGVGFTTVASLNNFTNPLNRPYFTAAREDVLPVSGWGSWGNRWRNWRNRPRPHAMDLPPAMLRAATITLSGRRPRTIRQFGIDYVPYHLVTYQNASGTAVNMTLLAVPKDAAKHGKGVIEIPMIEVERNIVPEPGDETAESPQSLPGNQES